MSPPTPKCHPYDMTIAELTTLSLGLENLKALEAETATITSALRAARENSRMARVQLKLDLLPYLMRCSHMTRVDRHVRPEQTLQELCAHVKKGLLYQGDDGNDDRDREYVARLETLVQTLVDPYGSVPRNLFAEKAVEKEEEPSREPAPANSPQIVFCAAPSSATAVAAGGTEMKPQRGRPKNDQLQIDPFDDFAIIKAWNKNILLMNPAAPCVQWREPMPIQEADKLQQADDDDDDATRIARTHVNRSHESFFERVRRICSFKSSASRSA